ncbi:MAG TPA: hypothetical protein VJQ83_09045 [Tepidiformaceae bacterium]|nr:hypothetical protein [Tepidiformaceae bacterium]
MTLFLALLIAGAVITLAVVVGFSAARRAENHIGAWAWLIYGFLGIGMIFGATSVSNPLLSTFMWTKLTVFLVTAAWLFAGRLRRGDSPLPGFGSRQPLRS